MDEGIKNLRLRFGERFRCESVKAGHEEGGCWANCGLEGMRDEEESSGEKGFD